MAEKATAPKTDAREAQARTPLPDVEPAPAPADLGLATAIPGPAVAWSARAVGMLRPRDLVALQRFAGNRAVLDLVAREELRTRPTVDLGAVQRVGMVEPMPPGVREYDQLPGDYGGKSDTEKIAAIRDYLRTKSPSVVGRAWAGLSDEVGQAKANPDLFTQSVKVNDDILDHSAFDSMRERFKKDVEQTALNYTGENRELVLDEMARTGVEAEARGQKPDAEQDFAVQDVQKAAPDMEKVKKAKSRMLDTELGTREELVPGPVEPGGPRGSELRVVPVKFDPSGPPSDVTATPGGPTWDQVNAEWMRALAVEAAIIRRYPSAAYFMASGTDFEKLKSTTDIKTARALIKTALEDLAGKIDKAVPLIGSDLTYIDFPPIQQQLLAGQPAPSGTNWSKPVEKALAKEEIADATIANLLKTLGLATVGAAFFVLASIATAGGAAALGAFLFAAGAVTGVAQAGMSWDKYRDLATAQASKVDPELALVTGEQVEDASLSAILDSIFALVDVWQGVKGAYVGLKGGKIALEAGKSGAEVSARAALRGLAHSSNPKEVVLKALAELGPDEVRRTTGRSFEDLAEIVGKETDAGKRLVDLAAKGTSASAAAKELLEKLPKIAELKDAAEAGKVLQTAIDTYGYIGALRKVGGWAAIKNSAAMRTAAGEALETWRKSLVKELEEYIAKESDNMTKGVRTGTKEATSDLDVQVIGGAASELQQRAESWLAGRLGTDVKGAKNLLDAEIMIDPSRSHLIDIMKDIDVGVREEIAKRMNGYERQLVYGARHKEALKKSKEAAQEVLDEARDLHIEPLEFEPWPPSKQKQYAGLIDGWMAELGKTADPGKKADLVERISMAQASINASKPGDYVGGGVRVWVTGRAEDVEAIAKALNMDPADLRAVTAAQRVTAALTEWKWLDAAISQLERPSAASLDDLPKLSEAVRNIGKHGSRAAQQLRAPGVPNAKALDGLFNELYAFKEMRADELAAKVTAGELGKVRGKIDGLLSQLKIQTKVAVDALGADVKALNLPASQMAEFESLLKWQARYASLVDGAREATYAYIKLLHRSAEAAAKATLPEPEAPPVSLPPPESAPAPAP